MFPISKTKLSSFRGDERGSIAVMFGVSITALCLIAGLSLDIGRAYSSKAKLAQAADAAALAAVKGMRLEGLSDNEASDLARRVFDENMKGGSGNWTEIKTFNVTLDRVQNSALVRVGSAVPTMFGALAGIQTFNMPTEAAAIMETGKIEVSVQLDLTGSMCDRDINGWYMSPCTNHRKIQGLKNATKVLLDILIVPGPSTVRVALAPFTAGVNLGNYQSLVTGGRTTGDRCVYERLSETNQDSDVEPTGDDRYMTAVDLQAVHGVAPARPCPNAPVVPLTSDKAMLKSTVDAYVADGYTAGHNGTAWAWNLISPTFSPETKKIWPDVSTPAPYADSNTTKTAILMTDGVYNTKNGTDGNANQISRIAVDTCNAMKAAGIRVYTVGFELTDAMAINTLSDCASSPSDFHQPRDASELEGAFRAIANDIVKLRLTN